jgi:hypothetical protein
VSASAKPIVVGNGLIAATSKTFTRRGLSEGITAAIAMTQTIAMATATVTVKKVR